METSKANLETDKAAVVQAFTAYREALLAKNGKAAAALLTADSLAYYARLKTLALSAPEAELRRAPQRAARDSLPPLEVRAEDSLKTPRLILYAGCRPSRRLISGVVELEVCAVQG